MKKIILFLITLTTLTNVSFASFPVTENVQTEIIEYDSINNLPVTFIGVLVGVLSWLIFPLNLLLPIFIVKKFYKFNYYYHKVIFLIMRSKNNFFNFKYYA